MRPCALRLGLWFANDSRPKETAKSVQLRALPAARAFVLVVAITAPVAFGAGCPALAVLVGKAVHNTTVNATVRSNTVIAHHYLLCAAHGALPDALAVSNRHASAAHCGTCPFPMALSRSRRDPHPASRRPCGLCAAPVRRRYGGNHWHGRAWRSCRAQPA